MACGIPAIMSAVGVNAEIIRHGVNGYLAASPEEWYQYVCMLVESAEMRKEIGLKSRETVVSRYSVEANKNLYLEVFRNAKLR